MIGFGRNGTGHDWLEVRGAAATMAIDRQSAADASASGSAAGSKITAGQPYTYTPFPGDGIDSLTLYPWVGTKVAVSTISNSLSPDVMTKVVNGLDAAYSVYAEITGREPEPYYLYHGRLSLAELPDNPSYPFAEHGYLGYTGIEFQTKYFMELYNDAAAGTYDQAPFYELGRNFWFYSDQLGTVDPFVTGFAIANRFVSMEVAGLPGGPFGSYTFAELKTQVVDGLVKQFLSDTSYTLANTLGEGKALPGNWSIADLAGAFFFQIFESSSLESYARFYSVLAAEPAASTASGAFENFITAATKGTGIDFSFLLKPAGTQFMVGDGSDDHLAASVARTVVLGLGGDDVLTASSRGGTLLGGGGNDTLQGLSGPDLLYGGLGDDRLSGGSGNDRFDGGAGSDVLTGGAGNDLFIVDAGDRVIEGSGEGDDRIETALTRYTLPNNVENGTFLAATGVVASGNSANNRLVGGDGPDALLGLAGDDVLIGGGGDDKLNGNEGADAMGGGAGDDRYAVDSTRDTIREAGGDGHDTVVASVTYTLAAEVEDLVLAGGARSGTGNGTSNHIIGSAGADLLSGLGGNDRLDGGNGDDRLVGGAGVDLLTGGAGADRFVFAGGDSSASARGADRIVDFHAADHDRIDLSVLAVGSTLSFIGQRAFSGHAGEVRFAILGADTIVAADLDGDARADFALTLTGSLPLSGADFIFA